MHHFQEEKQKKSVFDENKERAYSNKESLIVLSKASRRVNFVKAPISSAELSKLLASPAF